ncbi:hypothetical protein HF282_12885 [Acidithiobacillus ferrooxidans]|uniref:hypothetical protein n=1 Tax=Acidithiobacillus ferriphilus TaxID=1689834 RepID=UPI002DBE5D7A|nr:hypothetical protein [Acidithiobacillus ferriphilus]MBU2818367.1 hypothetical protein [Acidithiobacillus ferrooxidans]MEB8474537.1 hypothetical protein [Acidithiobacillus ferriphilus]
MSSKIHNSIEVYADAACLIARAKLHTKIFDLGEIMVSATTLKAIERLAEVFPDRDMASELSMPPMHRMEFERARKSIVEKEQQRRRLATDPDLIIETLRREVGGCGQYYELWLPRMMGAISSHIRKYSVDKAVAAVLWAIVDCAADGPTDKDWNEAYKMESEVWAKIREAQE